MIRRILPVAAVLALLLCSCSGATAGGATTTAALQDHGVLPAAGSPAATRTPIPTTRPSAALDPLGGAEQAAAGEVLASGLALPGRSDSDDMLRFMDLALHDVAAYWQGVWQRAGYPASSVRYAFPAPGVSLTDPCEPTGRTDDTAAHYCPISDEIVVSQTFAVQVWTGRVRNTTTGPGFTTGDFSVAYVLAHEYAHSLQQELGILPGPDATARRFPVYKTELHADCWAGVWANSAYYQGALDSGDVQEAVETANDLGDDQFDAPDHHGTSKQRVQAFVQGYESGEPTTCDTWLFSDYS